MGILMGNLTSNNLNIDNSFLDDKEIIRRAVRASHIDSLDKLRQYPDLDASLIRFILGPISKNTKSVEYKPKDTSICKSSGCPVHKMISSMSDLPDALNDIPDSSEFDPFAEARLLTEQSRSCSNCPYNNSVCITQYNNPKKKYHLYNKQRDRFAGKNKIYFKQIQMKLLILLQGWPRELTEESKNDAILKDIYVPDLAQIINCNSEYLEDCLNELGILEILDPIRKAPHLYDIVLPNHFLKYKPANKDGSGYIQINQDILKELIHANSILSLRGMLLQLLKNPIQNDEKIQKVDTITFDEIKSCMPAYVKYKALFHKAMHNSLFIIDIVSRDRKIYFKANSNLEGIENQKNNIMKKNIERIAFYISKLKPTFVNENNAKDQPNIFLGGVNEIFEQSKDSLTKDITKHKPYISLLKDALLISLDYGINNVLTSLNQLEREFRTNGISIRNAGAMLRTKCYYNKYHGFGYSI